MSEPREELRTDPEGRARGCGRYLLIAVVVLALAAVLGYAAFLMSTGGNAPR